ncbi:uncharacterized protein LOC123273745 [Cotesia glomerata]|uniref:Uncharacterized protein n=1 Tax=Cotesia glomerata TaxID=32391 RepID=A0AAV7I8Q0_COTGL|nr:uncharacterized protein LOC123273745 [Cotesia glomerata]KAH0548501.1 hypothetical protein KQX54_002146 [Cotesia glomerata]
MSAQSLIASFTHDEEIDEWVVGDESVELKGYVNAIEGTKMVTSSKYPGKLVPLYKIVIDNGGTKRVRAVFWGRDAEKNSPIIHDRTIIEIKRGKVTPGNVAFNNPAHRISLLELYITSASTVTIFDEKFEIFVEPVQVLDLPMIYFKDLDATVCVQGYLKQEFDPIKSYGSIYGAGVLVDGETRLPVKIEKFNPSSTKIPKGTFLKMTGVVATNATGPPCLKVTSIDDVQICSDVAVLAPEILSPMGRRPPSKRKVDFTFDIAEKEKAAKKKGINLKCLATRLILI